MATRKDGVLTRQKLLDAAVHCFMDKGFHATTVRDICKLAEVTPGSFLNAFRTKEGVLYELVGYMFRGQFKMARETVGKDATPIMVYALETAIQLAVTELKDHLRDIYVEAYTLPTTSDYIYHQTAAELYKIFGQYMPDANEGDFYELEIASGSVMRGYMATPSTPYLTLEKKVRLMLTVNFAIYHVPEYEQKKALDYIEKLPLRQLAAQIIEELTVAIKADFSVKKAAVATNNEEDRK